MAYGVQIRTTQGLEDVSGIEVARFVHSFQTTATSGSQVVSNFSDANGLGHISVVSIDKKAPPQFSWNEGTKTLTWSAPAVNGSIPNIPNQSTNFRFIFWRFD